MKRILQLLLLLITFSAYSQTDSVTVDTVADYQGWGWNVIVIENNYITLAVIPEIGGRILKYSLGSDTSMAVNPLQFGLTYPPEGPGHPYATTWGYGGYKVWPAPQSRWNWPPPPTLAWGDYSYTLETFTNDSVVLFLESPVETVRAPDLRFQRRITVYSNSSRVKIDQIMINEGAAQDTWGVWDVTQSIVQHENTGDYNNFGVYFPVESVSDTWITGGAGESAAFLGEVADGIYGIEYAADEGKIFAQVPEGWISHVDKRDSQTYIKSFDLFEGVSYPDNNAHVEVYISGSNPYLEIEVVSPLISLDAGGGEYSFTEDWYATTLSGPTLHSNNVGAVEEAVEFDTVTSTLSGTVGSYYNGLLRISYKDTLSNSLGSETDVEVSPMSTILLDEQLTLPENTASIDLEILDVNENLLGILASVNLASEDEPDNPDNISEQGPAGQFDIILNKTVFSQSEVIEIQFSTSYPESCILEIYDMNGQLIKEIYNGKIHDYNVTRIPAGSFATGAYILKSQTGNLTAVKKIIIK